MPRIIFLVGLYLDFLPGRRLLSGDSDNMHIKVDQIDKTSV